MSSTSRAVTGGRSCSPITVADDPARLAFVDLWVLDEVVEVHVEQAGGVLRPLDVAADPEQRLRSAAQHELDLLLLLLGLLGRRSGVGGDRRDGAATTGGWAVADRRATDRREHPGVLRAASLAGVDHQACPRAGRPS